MRRIGASFDWSLLGATLIACGGGELPSPEMVAHPDGDYREVPYPPPAAHVETVPPSPGADARWMDGHWAWRLGRYAWERGGWVQPPEGARLSTWTISYRDDGTLVFAPNVWRGPRGERIADPPILVDANPSPPDGGVPGGSP